MGVVLLLMEAIWIRSWWIVYPIIYMDIFSSWKSCKPDPKMSRFDSRLRTARNQAITQKMEGSWGGLSKIQNNFKSKQVLLHCAIGCDCQEALASTVWWISRLWHFDLKPILKIWDHCLKMKSIPYLDVLDFHHVVMHADISWDSLEDAPPKVWRPLPKLGLAYAVAKC